MTRKLKWMPLNSSTSDKSAIMFATLVNPETGFEVDITDMVDGIDRLNLTTGRCVVRLGVEDNLIYSSKVVLSLVTLAISDEEEDASISELKFWRYRPSTSPVGYVIGYPCMNVIPVEYSIMKMIYEKTKEDAENAE